MNGKWNGAHIDNGEYKSLIICHYLDKAINFEINVSSKEKKHTQRLSATYFRFSNRKLNISIEKFELTVIKKTTSIFYKQFKCCFRLRLKCYSKNNSRNFIFVNNKKINVLTFFFVTGKKYNKIFARNVNREKVNVRFGAECFIYGGGKHVFFFDWTEFHWITLNLNFISE